MKEKNLVVEFIRPTKGKVILTIVVTLISSAIFLGPWEQITPDITSKPTFYSPLGITNPYLSLTISFAFFYLAFSLVWFIVRKIRNG